MPTLVLIPGLGADHRLFAPQCEAIDDIVVPPWLPPLKRESLADYGKRMAAPFADLPRPFFLGGVSFGGMVAMEMARHLGPEALFLVGTCRSRKGVPLKLRILERLNPLFSAKSFEGAKPHAKLLVQGLPENLQDLFAAMYYDTPGSFVKWAVSAIVRWPGAGELAMPVYQIHGRRDRLLPAKVAERCIQSKREKTEATRPGSLGESHVLPHGSHLINLTCANEVNAFIRERINRHSPRVSLRAEMQFEASASV